MTTNDYSVWIQIEADEDGDTFDLDVPGFASSYSFDTPDEAQDAAVSLHLLPDMARALAEELDSDVYSDAPEAQPGIGLIMELRKRLIEVLDHLPDQGTFAEEYAKVRDDFATE